MYPCVLKCIYSLCEVADWTFIKICKNTLTRHLNNVESVAFFLKHANLFSYYNNNMLVCHSFHVIDTR